MSNKKDRQWDFWLHEIFQAIEKIEHMSAKASQEEFMDNFEIHDVVFMNIANIGEFSKHIPDAIKDKYPHIEWRGMTAMRNVIAHDYPGVTLEDVWRTMQDDIPALKQQLMELAKAEGLE